MKQIIIILFFLFNNQLIIEAQNWNNYSDSLISYINKNDQINAKFFDNLSDSVMKNYRNKKDLNFGNYIYAKGVFYNNIDPYNSIKLLGKALKIYKKQKIKNYNRIRKIYYFLGNAYYALANKKKSKYYYKESYIFYDFCIEILKNKEYNSQIDRRNILFKQIIISDKLSSTKNIKLKTEEYLDYYKINYNKEFDFNLITVCRINKDLITQESFLNKYLKSYINDSLKDYKILFNIYFELFNNHLSRKDNINNFLFPDLVIKYGELAMEIFEKENFENNEKLKLLILGLQIAHTQKMNNVKFNVLQNKLNVFFGESVKLNSLEFLLKLEQEEKYDELKIEFNNYEDKLIKQMNIGGLVELYGFALYLYEKLILFNKSELDKKFNYLKSITSNISNDDRLDFESTLLEYYYLFHDKLVECLEICNRNIECKDVSKKLYFMRYKAKIESDLNLPNSITTLNEYLKIAIETYGAKSPMILTYYIDILSEQRWGENLKNQNFVNHILSIIYENKLEETEIAAKAWYYIGIHAKNIGNKEDWLKYINMSKSYLEKHGDDLSFGLYNLCILEIIRFDIEIEEFDMAKDYLNEVKKYLEEYNSNDKMILSGYYWALGDYFFYQKLYNDAYKSYDECLKIGLNNIAINFKLIICKSQIDNNISKTILDLEIFKKSYKIDFVDHYLYLLKYNVGDLVGAKKLLIDIISKEKEIVEKSFFLLSEDEMVSYYKTMSNSYEYLNNHLLNNIDSTFLANYISLRIFHKSLLLSSLVNKTDNYLSTDTLNEKIIKYKNNINKWFEGTDKNLDLIKDLKFKSREFEKLNTPYKNKLLRISGKEIKNVLKNDEAYVEIIRISKQSNQSKIAPFIKNNFTDSIFYGAILIRKDIPEKFILISCDGDLEKNIFNDYKNGIYNKSKDNKSYHLFFEPIEKELYGIKSIYFVADGVYNLLNVESMYNTQKKAHVIEYLKIQNLLNVHSLFTNRTNQILNNNLKFEIFGDPLFSFNKNDNILDSININRSSFFDFPKESVGQVKIKALPGSNYEVNNIAKIIKESGYKFNLYTGKQANENNLKNVFSPYLLHIATHGYFLNNDSSSIAKNILKSIYNNEYYNDPSLNSGMFLAGAEVSLNKPTEFSKDNGIFTAMEVRALNLKNTELVVLSACETGLGKTMPGVGIINLPRNFILSGANSVIMSLWPVSDVVTNDLMTKFYSNWIRLKMPIEDALLKAKIEIKKLKREPFYWAGFVLVK